MLEMVAQSTLAPCPTRLHLLLCQGKVVELVDGEKALVFREWGSNATSFSLAPGPP